MADFDAIVVGAGHNGLVCAAYLARSGWRTLVLEKSFEVGGGLRSDELTLPGFIHDRYATSLGMFAGSPIYQDFKDELDQQGVRFLRSEYPYANIFDKQPVQIFRDRDKTIEGLKNISASDSEGWRRLVEFYARVSPVIQSMFYAPMPSFAPVASGFGTLTKSGPFDFLRLISLLGQSSQSCARKYFNSDAIRSIVEAWGYHLDYPPHLAGGAVFAFVSAMASHVHGMQIVEGGAGKLSQGLAEIIRRNGGAISTGTEVAKVVVRNGTAVGVETKRGDIYSARKIIANVTTQNLFGKLIGPDELPSGFFRRISKFRYGPGTFIVHLALGSEPQWKVGEDLNRFGYVHLNTRSGDLEETYKQSIARLLPARPLLIVSQTSMLDATRAPVGKHVLRIHVRTVPGEIRGDAADAIVGSDWQAVKYQFAERVLDLVEENVIGLRDSILQWYVETPEDIEAENPNFVHGDCVSGSHHLDQSFMYRPILGWSKYEMPTGNLLMIGASTWPGGGINGGSGYLAAQRLLNS